MTTDHILALSTSIDFMIVPPFTEVEMIQVISKLNDTYATGVGYTPIQFRKCVSVIINLPLQNFINNLI